MSSSLTRSLPSSQTQLPGVAARHLEHRQAAHVGQDGVPHGAGEVLQLGQALGRQDETGAVLAQLAEHGLVIDAGHGLHLVDDHQRSPALWQGQALLLPDHRVHQVEQGGPHQGGHVPAHAPLGGGHQEDAALQDGLADVYGGAGLAQDGPGLLGGGVVGQAGLHRRDGLAPPFPVPTQEVLGPEAQQVGVVHLLQDLLAELGVGNQAQPVQDGVLLLCLHPLVGFVKALDCVLQDGLHPGTPLLPQAVHHPHHRVGGAVAVGEDAGVQQVDARGAPRLGQVDELHLVRQGLGDLFQQAGHQVGVGVDDDDGVDVPARCFFLELVGDDVVHQGGLAHAGAGHVEVVAAAQQVLGKMHLTVLSRRGPAHRGAALHPPGRGEERAGAERSSRGVSSPSPGGCQRAAASRTPRTLRLPNSPGPAGWRLTRGTTGRTVGRLTRAACRRSFPRPRRGRRLP